MRRRTRVLIPLFLFLALSIANQARSQTAHTRQIDSSAQARLVVFEAFMRDT